ncbi:hypothetical protein PZA11_004747 [Diplocarpon coronariae]
MLKLFSYAFLSTVRTSVTLIELDHLLEKRDKRTLYIQTRRKAIVRPLDLGMD